MEKQRLNYKNTFILGLGFFCISMTWAMYNSFVPIFLSKYITSTFLIGVIMTFDNLAAITLQPIFGALSDRTNNRFGRRMPYLLIGIPVSALFFSLIPFEFNLISLFTVLMCYNIVMSTYRAPTVALMPDLTPSPLRSKANGIINFMGGLGALLALFAGGKIYDMNKYLPFAGAAGLMLIAVLVLYKFIKEPNYAAKPEDKTGGIIEAFKEILTDKDKSALFLLFAILFWFIGYQGIEALFTLYGVKYLQLTEGAATTTLGFFSAAFLAFAIPSGIIATKVGRKKTIQIGLMGLSIVFALIVFTKSILMIRILLLAGGICWALININSYPMVVEMASNEKLGAYTGLYYFFSSMAAIIGPPLFGRIIDLVSFGALFIAALCFLLVALLLMSRVKKGEVKQTVV